MAEKIVIFRDPEGRELTEEEALQMEITDATNYANALILDVAPVNP